MVKKTQEEINQIIELYNTGMTGSAIARKLGFERHCVMRILNARGLRSNMFALNQEKESIVKQMCEENRSASFISKCLGVSTSVISRYKRIHGYDKFDAVIIKGEKEKTLLDLYHNGKKDNEIAKEIGVSTGAVWFYRKHNGLKTKFKHSDNSKIDNVKFEELFNKGLVDKDIAKELGMSRDGVYSHRMRHGYIRRNYLYNEAVELTQYQKEVLIGTLLGDSSLVVYGKNGSPRFSCAHSPKQKDLTYHKAKIFESLGSSVAHRITKKPDKRNGKFYETYTVLCPANPAFIKYYNSFYVEKKVIPFDLLDDFTEVSLAFMFMDDGFKCTSGYGIATNCYSRDSLKKFCDFLKEKFNLTTSINKSNQIYIKACSRDLFTSLVEKHIIDCVKYKLHKVS